MDGRPPFVVLDGVDGCGKSTQAARLVEALRGRGLEVEHLREPGGTPEGEALRALILGRDSELSAGVEALLFCAARRQLLERRVAPALERGAAVVCERFHPSTFAYQAAAGGLPEGPLLDLLHTWAGSPAPDRVLLLELPVPEAAARRGAATDRIEDRGLEFQEAVRRGLERYAELAPELAQRVDAAGSEDEVAGRVWAAVEDLLG
ncbi:MAG: dTMP kinase [Planctomycetes bacterium]|nr:dTMP kinase [Planctomycetota bacterium]